MSESTAMSESTSEALASEKGSPPAATHKDHHDDAHGDGHHDHPKDLAHHFDSYQQQFDAGKMGIWLFLLTEVLFFSGLFCAYTIYRAQHPEIFVYAHYHLNTTWGAVNTCVLILSSLTAAWAVRNAQEGDKTKLVVNIVVTIACAFTFMGVKYVEYSHKWHDHLLWGHRFAPTEEVYELEVFKHKHPEAAAAAERIQAQYGVKKAHGAAAHGAAAPDTAAHGAAAPDSAAAAHDTPAAQGEPPKHGDVAAVAIEAVKGTAGAHAPEPTTAGAVPAPISAFEKLSEVEKHPLVAAGYTFDPKVGLKRPGYWGPDGKWKDRVQIFFGIYFFMTGLHGFHVLAGIVVWVWLLRRAIKGEFGPNYFGPIDYAALYWHLVDLIWIYLFPLLYLIH